MKLAVSSHVALIDGQEYDGIGNSLKATLDSLGKEYVFVRNSMDGELASEVHKYNNGVLRKKSRLIVFRKFAPLRYLSEVIATVIYFRKKQVDIFIGIDPLNALAAILLKKLGKVKCAVFFTADYSEKRFANSILNRVYHAVDRYCVKEADEVWCVSSRIVEVRVRMGAAAERCVLVPNVPPKIYAKLQNTEHNRFEIITSGIIDKQLDYDGLIHAVARLKVYYPELSLTVAGNGPEEGRLRELTDELGIRDRVHFLGKISLKKYLERVAGAGIGAALYTGVWGFNFYGDSTKCREFFNYGLPVITTDTHSTVKEVKKFNAGLVVDKNIDIYVDSIAKILNNYDKYAYASAKLGLRYSGVHEKEIKRLFKSYTM